MPEWACIMALRLDQVREERHFRCGAGGIAAGVGKP
jgi:hypothetical protein